MKKAADSYYLYQAMLESGLSQRQRDKLLLNEDLKMIASGLKKIGKSLGLDILGSQLSGALSNLLSTTPADETEKISKDLTTTQNSVKAEVERLRNLAPKGVDQKVFVSNILNAFLRSYGLDPRMIANPKPLEVPGNKPKEGTTFPGGLSRGEELKIGKPETTITAAAAAAEIAKQPIEKAIENAKDMDQKDVMVAWSKSIADKISVDQDIVSIFLDDLINKGYIIAESFKSLKKKIIYESTISRWKKLAGFSVTQRNYELLTEADVDTIAAVMSDPKLMQQAEFKDEAEKKEAIRIAMLPEDFATAYGLILKVFRKDKESNSEKPNLDAYNDAFAKLNPIATQAIIKSLRFLSSQEFNSLDKPDVKMKFEQLFKNNIGVLKRLADDEKAKNAMFKDGDWKKEVDAFYEKMIVNKAVDALEKTAESEKKAGADQQSIKKIKSLFKEPYEKAIKKDPEFSDAELLAIFRSFDKLKVVKLKISV